MSGRWDWVGMDCLMGKGDATTLEEAFLTVCKSRQRLELESCCLAGPTFSSRRKHGMHPSGPPR